MKLLDFGLARAQSVSDPTSTSSSAGLLAGTPSYMAPEQVRGEPVDASTDIFAAGILLYELVTGERPFRGATFVDVLQALPVRIRRLKRIAVLPFRLLRPDPEIDRLRLGLADALGTSLAGHDDIVVRSALALPASVADGDDVRRAGSELDADYVLTGTVLRSGARVRVSAQIVHVGTGHTKWAQQTDGTLEDLFGLQDKMASTMISSLPAAKTPSRESGETPRSELAYRLYLQANQLARQPQTWMAARSLYRDSTAADDRFAPSWAGRQSSR